MIKVALTGAHGTGKTTITQILHDRAKELGWNVQVVTSPTRHIKHLGEKYGLTNNFGLDYQFEWMLMSEMRLRQWVAERELGLFASGPSAPTIDTLLIGDRCLLDPLSYISDNIKKLEAGRIRNDPEELARMKQLYGLARHFAFTDVEQFWTKVYYKPIHPDHAITVDSDRLGDRDYQAAVDAEIKKHWSQARLRGVSSFKLHPDRDEAADQIWNDVLMLSKRHCPA